MKLLTKTEYKKQKSNSDFSCDGCVEEKEVLVVVNDYSENEWKFDYDHVFLCEDCLKKALKLIEGK